jgi:hypothetical protein
LANARKGDGMMRQNFDAIQQKLEEEVATRKKLGGYSPDAPTILFLCETLLELLTHAEFHDHDSSD